MKYNKNFAKILSDNTPEWGPIPLIVVTHHHEEGVDPYDTTERKLRPTAADYKQMEYLPVIDTPPSEPPPEGYHYEGRGYVYSQDGESIVREYELVEDAPTPPQPIMSNELEGEVLSDVSTHRLVAEAVKHLWETLGGTIPSPEDNMESAV